MAQIQQHMGNAGLPQDFGTQTYEQQVVELEKRGEDAAAGGVPGGHGAGGGRVSPPLSPFPHQRLRGFAARRGRARCTCASTTTPC